MVIQNAYQCLRPRDLWIFYQLPVLNLPLTYQNKQYENRQTGRETHFYNFSTVEQKPIPTLQINELQITPSLWGSVFFSLNGENTSRYYVTGHGQIVSYQRLAGYE